MSDQGQMPTTTPECWATLSQIESEIDDHRQILKRLVPRANALKHHLRALIDAGSASDDPLRDFAELRIGWRDPRSCVRQVGALERGLRALRTSGRTVAHLDWVGDPEQLRFVLTFFRPTDRFAFDHATRLVTLGTRLATFTHEATAEHGTWEEATISDEPLCLSYKDFARFVVHRSRRTGSVQGLPYWQYGGQGLFGLSGEENGRGANEAVLIRAISGWWYLSRHGHKGRFIDGILSCHDIFLTTRPPT